MVRRKKGIPLKVGGDSFCRFAVIYHQGSFYAFGGGPTDSTVPDINRLDPDTLQWSKAGELTSERRAHAVTFDGTFFLIIGGWNTQGTDKCTLTDKTFTCVSRPSVLRLLVLS